MLYYLCFAFGAIVGFIAACLLAVGKDKDYGKEEY